MAGAMLNPSRTGVFWAVRGTRVWGKELDENKGLGLETVLPVEIFGKN